MKIEGRYVSEEKKVDVNYSKKLNEKKSINKEDVSDALFENAVDLEKVTASINEIAASHQTRFEINYNEKIDRYVVKIINQHEDEVVKEFPTKEFVRMLENINDFLGLFFDTAV